MSRFGISQIAHVLASMLLLVVVAARVVLVSSASIILLNIIEIILHNQFALVVKISTFTTSVVFLARTPIVSGA